MPRDFVKIMEITELPSAEAEVLRSTSGLARPNRALADRLSIEHRVSHELLVRAGVKDPEPWTPEEKLLRAIFGEKAPDAPDAGTLAEVGARLTRYQDVIRHPQGRVVFSAADEGEVERVEREQEGLPEGIAQRITVIVRFSGPLSVGDELWSGAEKLGVVGAIIEDGALEPRLYLAEGAAPRRARVERRLPTAIQRVEARGIGGYDPISNRPLSGEVLRDEQIEWLAARGARALISDFAAYKTGDPARRVEVFEQLTKLEPIKDGWSACNPEPKPEGARGAANIFSFFTKPSESATTDRVRVLDVWARACGLAIAREDHGLALSLRAPGDPEWSHGVVQSAATVSDDGVTPARGGLLCQKVFGPIRDYKCACGKYKLMSHRGTVCEKCGVEVIRSSVRRERFGHVELAAPIVPALLRSVAGAEPWSVLPIAPPDLRGEAPDGQAASGALNEFYVRAIERNEALEGALHRGEEGDDHRRALQASVDAVVDAAVTRLRDEIAPREPVRTDYSGSAVGLIDDGLTDRSSVPLGILTELARPILMGILETHGYATTIKGAKELLARDEDLRREVVRMAMFDRVLLLASPEPGAPAFVATAVEIGRDPVIRVPRAVAARLGLEDGDRISVHMPVSDAAQREAKDLAAGTLAAPPIEDGPSWVRDVTRADDAAAALVDRAAARAVDPCLWPPAAMLVGGYKLEEPPAPAIELGPVPPRPEKAPPPARLLQPLADLEISTRTLKRLEDAGIMTLLDLVQRTEMDLLKIKGFNRASLQEVMGLLATMDLSLGMRV